jgi:ubiquitin C-terminal hydrolase
MQDSIFDEATEESAHDIHQLFHMSKDLRNCHDKESVEAQKLKEVAAKIETKYNQMQKALKKGLDKAHAESNSTEMVVGTLSIRPTAFTSVACAEVCTFAG